MKASIKNVAAFLSAAILADGNYAQEEREVLGDIAEGLDYNADELLDAVEKAMKAQESLSDDELDAQLEAAGLAVKGGEKNALFEALIDVVLADGILAQEEVSNLLALAECLEIEEEVAIMMLVDMAKEEGDIEVEY